MFVWSLELCYVSQSFRNQSFNDHAFFILARSMNFVDHNRIKGARAILMTDAQTFFPFELNLTNKN